MQLVYGNMPLETVVASAFAAPLVELVGSTSLVMSVYSHLSGVGKTTAMMLAQAVWGHPRTGMSTLADTTNSMMKKIADLKSLPIYWDELRTKDQLEKVIDIVFQVTQGKGKARLNRDITQADAPSFTTMFVVASNYGIADTVYRQTESTEAGGLRVFEIEATPLLTIDVRLRCTPAGASRCRITTALPVPPTPSSSPATSRWSSRHAQGGQ